MTRQELINKAIAIMNTAPIIAGMRTIFLDTSGLKIKFKRLGMVEVSQLYYREGMLIVNLDGKALARINTLGSAITDIQVKLIVDELIKWQQRGLEFNN